MPSNLSENAFLRLPQVLALIPISKSAWWAGCKTGRYPKPIKLSPRTTAWRSADIAALVESGDLDQGAEPLTTQRMSELYPLFATSLLSLVKNAESAVTGSVPGDR